MVISEETPGDGLAVEGLHDAAFGLARHGLTAYRFRKGVVPVSGLGFVMRDGTALVGTVRFWPVRLVGDGGEEPVLLLGPLAVLPELKGAGIGTALLRRGLEACCTRPERAVFLIGDLPYYGRVGFRQVLPSDCLMPGPVDPARLLFWSRHEDFRLPDRFSLKPVMVESAAATGCAVTGSP